MRVLIVEDDRELAESLARVLDESGMVAEIATNGREADFLGCTEKYDAAVLDLGLPELDGVSVLQHWREQGRRFPVLILTGRGRWSDKLSGFGAGADDYLTKPFMHEEVVLRLRALMRRAYGHAEPVLQVGPLSYDTHQGRFSMEGKTPRLYRPGRAHSGLPDAPARRGAEPGRHFRACVCAVTPTPTPMPSTC